LHLVQLELEQQDTELELLEGYMQIQNDGSDSILLLILSSASGAYFNNKVYGRTTDDPGLINRAMDQINEGFPNTFCSTSPPTQLIIGTWIDYLKTGSNQGSNFQLIVVTNGSITFGIALYVDVSIASAQTTGIESYINSVTTVVDYSLFPFGTTVMNAPSMMLNSNIPGTYIFSLNDIPPDTCSSVCYSCKARLFQLACEARRINGEDVPASCNN
uniref:NIDO domain-containing protein n=1 Tax=Amphimedon queenslandica TaxID=400682 RepID=A0A1X7SJD2_AMPQE